MEDSIWTTTLEAFRDRVAGIEPVPAGVSAAAVTAALGFSLLVKVLEIAVKRKNFAGDRGLVQTLLIDARGLSDTVSRLADEDIAAFHEYLGCLRRKEATGAALRKTIDVPLNVARAATAGLELCEKSAALVHAFIVPDLGTATILLAAAIRATLLTITSNLEQLPEGDPYRNEVVSQTSRLTPKN